jgi:phosphatidate cytidylyltransferase
VFKQRLITGLVLAPLVLAAVWFAPVWLFSLLIAFAVLYGAWEWSEFCRFGHLGRGYYVGCLALLILLVAWLASPLVMLWINSAAVLFWLMAAVCVLRYPALVAWWQAPSVKLLIGWLVLLSTWLALSQIKAMSQGEALILLLLFIVWGADTGAYAAGKLFGRHKMIPAVSPGKTLEGLLGGVLTCALVGWLFAWLQELPAQQGVYWLLLSLVVGLASVLGDLFESMLKRERGIKDSGTLLPGHGGMLDRIDSITAAAPVFLLGLSFLPLV